MDARSTNVFLAALAAGSSVSEAAAASGFSSSALYSRRKTDADFAEAWRLALEDSTDILEKEARRRAIDGVEEPVVYQGQLTPVFERDESGELVMEQRLVIVKCRNEDGETFDREESQPFPRQARNADGSLKWLTIRKPSDMLLAMLLKGRRRDVYGVERTEITGAGGGPLVIDDAARASRIAALLKKAGERKDLDDLV